MISSIGFTRHSKQPERAELIQLQDEYPNVKGPFWYNVIVLFDEHLYLPTPSD
jgi:hypothetical protein